MDIEDTATEETATDTATEQNEGSGSGDTANENQQGSEDESIPSETASDENASSVDEAAGDPQGEQAGEKPSAAPTLDLALAFQALKAGLSEEEISELGADPKALNAAIKVLSRRNAGDGQDPKKPQAEQKQEPAADEFKLELPEDEFDPKMVTAIKGLHEHHSKQLQQLSATVQQLNGIIQQQQSQAMTQRVDGLFSGLGKEYEEIVGKGSFSELDTTSTTFKNRAVILQEMDAIAAGYTATKRAVPQEPELFKRAVQSVFGDKTKTIARKQIALTLTKSKSQMLSRPTHREGKDVRSDEQKTHAILAAKIKTMTGEEVAAE